MFACNIYRIIVASLTINEYFTFYRILINATQNFKLLKIKLISINVNCNTKYKKQKRVMHIGQHYSKCSKLEIYISIKKCRKEKENRNIMSDTLQ